MEKERDVQRGRERERETEEEKEMGCGKCKDLMALSTNSRVIIARVYHYPDCDYISLSYLLAEVRTSSKLPSF